MSSYTTTTTLAASEPPPPPLPHRLSSYGQSRLPREHSLKTSFKPSISEIARLIWGFTGNDFFTFIIPNAAFGVFGALASSRLAEGQLPSCIEVLQRLPIVIAFNWYTVLICDLANQRTTESVKEDLVNKPWRPIPSKKITQEQTRRVLLGLVFATMAMNAILGVWTEGTILQIFTWLYNDLGGGDEVIRDVMLAAIYGTFNAGSLKIVLGEHATISRNGYTWIAMISGVILTTMQVQDLKDQRGDRLRDRKTLPLVIGDSASRVIVAFFTLFWSVACARFWALGLLGYVITLLCGAMVTMKVLTLRTVEDDTNTWKLWCKWLICLYLLPEVAALVKG